MEYIEREAACTKMPDDYYGWRDKQILNFIPAADVVPVVRCGECANKFDWPWCGMFPDDGYCSVGERKDGDGD